MRHLRIVKNEEQKLMSYEIRAVEVFINSESQGIYTVEAYHELTLQMSTGDFHTHKTVDKIVQRDDGDLIHLETSDLTGEPMFARGDQY